MSANTMFPLRTRLVPLGFTYSSTFHKQYSVLCKTIRKTPQFYDSLADLRESIKEHGIETVIEAVENGGKLTETALEYFRSMKSQIPMLGLELQARVLAYLYSIQ